MRSLLLLALAFAVAACADEGVVLSPAGPLVVDIVAAGRYHTCGIDGTTLYCWGSNADGALGVGDNVDRLVPTTVAGDDWKEIAAGERHTCARRTGGSVWCWGDDSYGQLGTSAAMATLSPAFVSTSAPAVELVTMYDHTCAVDETHALYCWGANAEGQLAQDDPFPATGVDRDQPVRVGADSDWVSVGTGQGHSCGIRAPGDMWCWGRNSDGELGLGDGAPEQIREPNRAGDASDWIDVRAGQGSTCGLRSPGALWCWGDNHSGEDGLGNLDGPNVPTQVGDIDDWKVISIDTFHGCGVRSDSSLYCWGRNVEGQLGLGDQNARLTPTRIGSDSDWASVAAGRFHTCAVKRDRTVLCTGQNDHGQLGVGDTTDRTTFTPAVFAAP